VVSCRPGDTDAQVLVSAAASLTDAFTEIEASFEEANPGVDVVLNVGASSALGDAILEGAPVDVYAPADLANMEEVEEALGLNGSMAVFARNSLQIAVPPGNPAGIDGLGDFAEDELLLGLCAEEVPCGSLARRALASAGVDPEIDTHEHDARALLTKIEADELDAGIVYSTDVISSGGGVEGVVIPADHNQPNDYPIAVMRGSPSRGPASAFVEFVLSAPGREILHRYGFTTP
jgi:molybdate transport system substrate-binding protein